MADSEDAATRTGDDALRRLRELALLSGARVSDDNHALLLEDGERTFAALLDAIAGARRQIALSAHVFWGAIAEDVGSAIAARARDGLACCVLLDGVQALKTRSALLSSMRRAGVDVALARTPWRHPLQLNRRLHRSLVVVDGELALVGGVGIGDDWRRSQRSRPFRDRELLLRGPIVEDVLGAFFEEWLEATGELPCRSGRPPEPVCAVGGAGAPMLALRSRAGTGTSPLERALRTTIVSARSALDISTAYFVPPRPIRDALSAAALRGVRVRVLLPGAHSNRPAARRAGQGLYADLLQAGVEIHEYRPAMLHAKTIVVDGGLSAVGSANVDDRSLLLDDELVVFAADARLSRELQDAFEEDLRDSDQVHRRSWQCRPLGGRVIERAALLVRRDL